MITLIGTFVLSVLGFSQVSGSPKGKVGVVTRSASFASLVPAGLGGPASIVLPFHLTIPAAMAARGYRLSAVSNFVFSPSRPAAGGKSIAASDVGVGIAGISFTPGVAADLAVSAGFDYDPSAARGANGTSHYAGAAAGRANLADLLAGRDVLRVGKISAASQPAGTADLTVTVKLAVQPQFLTPGGFSGTITLTASESR